MEILKTLTPKKDSKFLSDPYKNREILVKKDEDGEISFYEKNTETEKEGKLTEKVMKWAVESGRLDYEELKDYIEGLKKPDLKKDKEIKMVKPKKTTKISVNAGKEYKYSGRSKKITSEIVTLISNDGKGKCKVKDKDGNVVVVTESTLKAI
jgi:hypothetical protein